MVTFLAQTKNRSGSNPLVDTILSSRGAASPADFYFLLDNPHRLGYHENMSLYIQHLLTIAAEYGLSDISREVADHADFDVWSGSAHSYQHHYGDGGLARHTFEVVTLCRQNAHVPWISTNKADPLDEKVLFLAALFHDIGKMWDITRNAHGEWVPTQHKRLIHHVSRSAIEWSKAATKHSIDEATNDKVLHAILSHHGSREWGSPVMPNTKVAWILHLCDGLSARVDDVGRLDLVHKPDAIR